MIKFRFGGGQDREMSGELEYQSVIRSYNANNITITGGGIIDGQGSPWWDCGRKASLLINPPCNNHSRYC
jgi:hypothetical protein